MDTQFWFKSDLFTIDKDEEINPGHYGKSLALWLAKQLRIYSYEDIQVFAEDWGWYVSCKYQNTYLYANCGNVFFGEKNPINDIVWTIFAEVKSNFFSRLFRKAKPKKNLLSFTKHLEIILKNERCIQFCSEP